MTSLLFKQVRASRIVGLTILIIAANALEVLGLSLFIPIIEFLQGGAARRSEVAQKMLAIAAQIGIPLKLSAFLWALCFLFFIKAVLTMWLRYLSVTTAASLQDNIRTQLFSKLLTSRLGFVEKKRQGELLSVLTEHTVRVSVALFLLIQISAQWIAVAAYSGFVITISWQLTALALVLGAAAVPSVRAIGRKAQIFGRGYTGAFESLQQRGMEALYAKKLINAMDWSGYMAKRFEIDSESVRINWQWMAFWSNSPGILMQPVAVAILSIIIIFSLQFDLSAALLGAFAIAFIRLIPNIQAAVSMGVDYQASKSSIDRVTEMLQQMELEREPTGETPYLGLIDRIRLEAVGFSYDGQSQVLVDANLDFAKGKTIALVGVSGSGKTTIADLILGLIQPCSGRVLVDKSPLSELDLSEYRARIAYVSQDPMLFHDSIRNNLVLGLKRCVDETEIQRVCRLAGAWEFIDGRPKGLDAIVGDRGSSLSGGQKQRIALTRALLRHPEILVLDEATSALDQESEQWIQQTLREIQALGTVTVIVIAHRYSTIEHADLIYEVQGGVATCLGNWGQARDRLVGESSGLQLI